jgi:tetratricopeptide (TPR) repeat protein
LARRLLWGAIVLSSLSLAHPAVAQGDSKAAAKVHFQKGVAAFNERRYADAAEEFDTAYRLSPAYVVLYNIGQVNVALGNPVEAVRAFDEYLKQGASSIPAARREEVQAEIEEQRGHIGTLNIVTHPEQAEVRVDGKLVGVTPLAEQVRVKAGHHTVEAVLAPHQPELRELEVPGQATVDVDLTFAALPAPAPPVVAAAVAPPPPAPPPPAPVVVRVDSAPPASAPSEAPPPSSGFRINWMRTGGYVIAAAGVGVAVGGGIYALNGASKAAAARDQMALATTPEEFDAAQPAYDLGKARNQRGWVIAAGGGAGVLVGILIAAAAPDLSRSASVSPWLTAHGGGFDLHRSF